MNADHATWIQNRAESGESSRLGRTAHKARRTRNRSVGGTSSAYGSPNSKRALAGRPSDTMAATHSAVADPRVHLRRPARLRRRPRRARDRAARVGSRRSQLPPPPGLPPRPPGPPPASPDQGQRPGCSPPCHCSRAARERRRTPRRPQLWVACQSQRAVPAACSPWSIRS